MDLIEMCDKCKLSECINCEHSWADVQKIKNQLAEKDRQFADLEKENEVLRKALELACEDMVSYSGIDYDVLYYVEQAKEEGDED